MYHKQTHIIAYSFFQFVYECVEQCRFYTRSQLNYADSFLRTDYSYPLHSAFWASMYPCQDFHLISWHLSFLKNFWQGILLKVLEIPVHSINCHPLLWRNPVRLQSKTSKERQVDSTIIFNLPSTTTLQYFIFC